MAYRPCCEQEERDREVMLDYIRRNDDAFLRTNLVAHMTASGWVVNPARDKVLMAYHKIYDSWSWTGGHADGECDLLSVALRECREETGVRNVHPVSRDIFSLEVLTVDGHEKRGVYVPSHLHMAAHEALAGRDEPAGGLGVVRIVLEADDRDALSVCEEENSGVAWFALDDALKVSTEPWFVERIYKKLNDKLKTMQF